MKTRSNHSGTRLKLVLVKAGAVTHAGLLLFKTDEFIVLVNNMVKGTDVGPLKAIRSTQVEPECDVMVLPRRPDMTLEFLGD